MALALALVSVEVAVAVAVAVAVFVALEPDRDNGARSRPSSPRTTFAWGKKPGTPLGVIAELNPAAPSCNRPLPMEDVFA